MIAVAVTVPLDIGCRAEVGLDWPGDGALLLFRVAHTVIGIDGRDSRREFQKDMADLVATADRSHACAYPPGGIPAPPPPRPSTPSLSGVTEGEQLHAVLTIGEEALKVVWRTTLWFKVTEWVSGLSGLDALQEGSTP